jgi:hypothetical protein
MMLGIILGGLCDFFPPEFHFIFSHFIVLAALTIKITVGIWVFLLFHTSMENAVLLWYSVL